MAVRRPRIDAEVLGLAEDLPTGGPGVAAGTDPEAPDTPEGVAPLRTRADRQRDRVLRAAVEIFGRQGYRATSMLDIAAEVGLGKPTLYHYFSSKEELLTRLYRDVLDESLRSARQIVATAPTPLDALRQLVASRVVYTCKRQSLLKVFFEEEAELPPALAESVLGRRREFEEIFRTAVTQHLDDTGGRLPVSVAVYVNACLGAANWVYKWYDPAGPRSPEQLGQDIADVVLRALPGGTAGPSGQER